MSTWLKRWADASLRVRLFELETRVQEERARSRVLQAEVDSLAAVVARDRARVLAETAQFARDREGVTHGR